MMFFGHLLARGGHGLPYPYQKKIILELSNELLCAPNGYCMKNNFPKKLSYQLTTSGPTKLLVLLILGLGFWTIKVLSLC